MTPEAGPSGFRDYPEPEPVAGAAVKTLDLPFAVYADLLACALAYDVSLHWLCNVYRAGRLAGRAEAGDPAASAERIML